MRTGIIYKLFDYFLYICTRKGIFMKSQKLIYSLCCPFTNAVHYIGKSTQGMIRPMQHLSKSHSVKVVEWVEDLKKINHAPTVKILEYVAFDEDLDARERYWIQREINKGSLLLNASLVTPLLISHNLDYIINGKTNDEYLRIGKFIKEKRKSVNLTQPELAEKAGVGLRFVRELEHGKKTVQLDKVNQVLALFGSTLGVVRIENKEI
jgi:y4mF family transcriptional regulator